MTIAQEAASQALSALSAAIKSNAYEGARYAAAALTLRALRSGPDSATTADAQVNVLVQANWPQRFAAWKSWDGVISAACAGLSSSGETVPAVSCLPTDDQVMAGSAFSPGG